MIEKTDQHGNTIAFEVTPLLVVIKKKERYWTAFNPHFRALGYSKKSEDDAVKDLRESLGVFFDVHLQRGTLDQALLEFGWKKQNNKFQQPKLGNIIPSNSRKEYIPYAIA